MGTIDLSSSLFPVLSAFLPKGTRRHGLAEWPRSKVLDSCENIFEHLALSCICIPCYISTEQLKNCKHQLMFRFLTGTARRLLEPIPLDPSPVKAEMEVKGQIQSCYI